LHLVSRNLLQIRIAELPYGKGIEPELGAGLGAERNRLDARLVIFVTLAVRPKTDLVKVLELAGFGIGLQRLEKVVVDVDIVEDRLGIGGEGAGIGLVHVMLVRCWYFARLGIFKAYLEEVQIPAQTCAGSLIVLGRHLAHHDDDDAYERRQC
jgi:hypothetical protein